MNSLASPKCARHVLMILAAISSLLFTAGCGSSSSSGPPPLNGGFTNASLTGQYLLGTREIPVPEDRRPVAKAKRLGAVT